MDLTGQRHGVSFQQQREQWRCSREAGPGLIHMATSLEAGMGPK